MVAVGSMNMNLLTMVTGTKRYGPCFKALPTGLSCKKQEGAICQERKQKNRKQGQLFSLISSKRLIGQARAWRCSVQVLACCSMCLRRNLTLGHWLAVSSNPARL